MPDEAFASVLERVTSDAVYRRGVQESPTLLESHAGLSPDQARLMTAVVEAAYGVHDGVVSEYKLRMCAVATDD
jgi:hypothetical protein